MLPLEGLTVIAVEQAVAAPFCSSRLADAGAHVIKVERPEGDFARGYDAAAQGQSSYFVWLNRGKDSVVIDLATKEGRQELEQLIAGADVLLQNLKPGSMHRRAGSPLAGRHFGPRYRPRRHRAIRHPGSADRAGTYRQGRRHPDLDVRRDGRLAFGAAAQRGSRQSTQADGAGPSLDRALRGFQLKGRQGNPDLDPERARMEKALRGC